MYKSTGLEQDSLKQYYSNVNTEVLQSNFHYNRLHAESHMHNPYW